MTEKGQTSCEFILVNDTVSILIEVLEDDVSFSGAALE